MNYFNKMRGHTQSPPRVGMVEILWSWVGSFLGIAAVGLLHFRVLDQSALIMIIGSFGASAVLVYGAIRSPLAQPRNLIGGHVLSAIVGVAAYRYLGGQPWLAAALAVSVSIALMHLTKTLHPPGGATCFDRCNRRRFRASSWIPLCDHPRCSGGGCDADHCPDCQQYIKRPSIS